MPRIITALKLEHTRANTSGNNFPGSGKVRNFMGSGLWILILEGAVALGLLLFIVWWTLPKRPETKRPEAGRPEDRQ